MAFLGFKQKRGGLQDNFDLDMPPEPPKIGIEDDFSSTDSPDEELMPYLKTSKKQNKPKMPESYNDELPELPALPDLDDENPAIPPSRYGSITHSQLPAWPEEHESDNISNFGDLKLPQLPDIKKEKKGLFSFLKLKKAPKKAQLQGKEEFSNLPPLPDFGSEHELPELPSFSNRDEEYRSEQEFEEAPISALPARFEQPTPKPPKPQKEKKITEQPLTKFITLNEFKSIQNGINDSKSSLKGIDSFFSDIDSAKANQDKKYEGLYNSLQDIHRKILFIDKTLFKEV